MSDGRAEGHADADLACPLGDHVGHQPEDAYRAQQQRQRRHGAEQRHFDSLGRERPGQQILHAIEAGGRQIRIGAGQRALHPGGQSLDRACRAHNPVRLNPHVHEREEMGIHLRGRNVHGLLGHERRDRVQTGGNGHISYLAYDQRIFVDVPA